MLGSSMRKVAVESKNETILFRTGLDVDVTNIKHIEALSYSKFDAVVHLAAETDHLYAERHPELAYFVNQTGTQNMVEYARKINVPFVYIGTCGIFDGTKDSYIEDDIPCPLNHYGRSKYYGEICARSYDKHYILRSGWGIGGGPVVDHKFIGLIWGQRFNKRIFAINDVFGSPSYFVDFSKTLISFLENKPPFGTYNVAGTGGLSRYEVAKTFLDTIGWNGELVPVSYEEYHKMNELKVPYTKCEVLNTKKLISTGLSKMDDSLRSVERYAKDYFL